MLKHLREYLKLGFQTAFQIFFLPLFLATLQMALARFHNPDPSPEGPPGEWSGRVYMAKTG